MKNKKFAVVLMLFLFVTGMQAQAAPVMVDGAWLKAHLNDPGLVLVDMTSDDTQYQRFHLPGAVRLPYQALVQKRRDGVSVRIDDQRLFAILGILGIQANSHVVIYDDMGGLQAARLFWELERIGHQAVSVLDGGLVKWVLDGRKVVNKPAKPVRVSYRPMGPGRQNEADIQQVMRVVSGGGALLLDVRTEQEYTGNPRMKRSGHIPGAILWPWQQAVDFGNGFTAKDADLLAASLKKAGVTKDLPVITYCQTGHRASRAYLTLRRLGFDNVRMYDGSMSEWSRTPEAPLKTGSER